MEEKMGPPSNNRSQTEDVREDIRIKIPACAGMTNI
jgi:hypothetical protein